MKGTACPRSSDPFYVETYYIYSIVYSDPFYVETYYIKWVNTTWTFKQYMRQFLIYLVKFLLILYVQEVVGTTNEEKAFPPAHGCRFSFISTFADRRLSINIQHQRRKKKKEDLREKL